MSAPAAPVRVAHVIAPSPAGGAETVVVALAAAAKDRTRAIIINPSSPDPTPLTVALRERGVAADEVRCGHRRYRAESAAIEQLLRAHGTQLVHTHGYHASWVAWHAARRIGIPAVATVHGYLNRSIRERLYNVIDRRLLRRFQQVIAVSQPIHDQLVASGLDASRVHLVQNGLSGTTSSLGRAEARARLGIPGDARTIGWIGRLSPEKGADLFLQAVAAAGSSYSVLIGDGPEQPRLEQIIREQGLGQRVKLAGFQRDAAALLPAFDVLALSSRTEGTPMVVLEAVSAGIPVVAFRVGGVPDVLGEDGAWLVPPLDVAALSASLREALDQPAEGARRVGRARARLMDRLSIDRWLARVEAVYGAAMGNPC